MAHSQRRAVLALLTAGLVACGRPAPELTIQIEHAGRLSSPAARRLMEAGLAAMVERTTGLPTAVRPGPNALRFRLSRKLQAGRIEVELLPSSQRPGRILRHTIRLGDSPRLRQARMQAFLRHAHQSGSK
jgi:hypothetical protein